MKLKYTITGFLEVDPNGEAYATKPDDQSVAAYEQQLLDEGASDIYELIGAFEAPTATVEEYVEGDKTVRDVIVGVLCGQALADHLGDVRDEEVFLWQLLGVDRPVRDHDSAWQNTKATLVRAGIPLPEHLADSSDDDAVEQHDRDEDELMGANDPELQ